VVEGALATKLAVFHLISSMIGMDFSCSMGSSRMVMMGKKYWIGGIMQVSGGSEEIGMTLVITESGPDANGEPM